ncbi:MAG: T9SS type A sorting domain-containing protein [Bacteroidales bacterium]|nr:T9SS type A sorting domain-containing protein [Bacteroidales bacterium]
MSIKKVTLFFLISFWVALTGFSQEKLSSVLRNPDQKGIIQVLKTGFSDLELPFVDDFSTDNTYPDQEKWINSFAYINNNFGINSPGIGVATLDALDSLGAIYDHANINSFQADYLTSKPINLDIGGDTTLYLSFYYQAQGLGDAPEARDSLILEFFTPVDNKWLWIWGSAGSESEEFKQVMIPVRGAIFLKAGFQFRFRNLASLANAFEPSLIANADHWHLDYIYLNKNRHYQDTIVNDLSLKRGTGSLLLNYSALPWEHFKQAGLNEVKTIFPLHLQNLSSSKKYYEPVFKIVDEFGSSQGFEKILEADEVRGLQELQYDATFNYGFTSDATDSARFTIELDLNPTEDDLIPTNTKIKYTQEFSNYYAYDDGSAEAGYGLTGDGSSNGMVAVQFHNFNQGDSLVGISIFFNRSFEDANRKYLRLAVWNEIDGQPGDLIHIQEGARASLDNGFNGFDLFMLDTARVVPENYYIGWQQVTNDFLNVGFDRNTNNQDKTFYKLTQLWKNTSYEGSIMVRPVFANKSKKSGVRTEFPDQALPDFNVYPNPVLNQLHLDFPDELSNASLTIIDINGREVMKKNRISHQIDLSSLSDGTFFIIVQSGHLIISRKIIKLYD